MECRKLIGEKLAANAVDGSVIGRWPTPPCSGTLLLLLGTVPHVFFFLTSDSLAGNEESCQSKQIRYVCMYV
ncbi:hypothetical protein HanXRQr2_Chr03g0134771 [Helianthus annuus]|uniref:Uncharacterized protein n=1 Tax=Helianthus annuus TaxID=4232 RepID=A0A9K3JKG2_HELAN|nr:hypothetical protein HanXRQr2_Chr03g0134771 [Helianthus annuus]